MPALTLNEVATSKSFELVALDSRGRSVPYIAAPVWSNSNPGVVDLILDQDEKGGQVIWLDGGAAQITASLEIKPGKILSAIALAVTCGAPEVQTIEIKLV